MLSNKKIIKYLFTGGATFAVEYGIFLLVVYLLSFDPWVGQAVSYTVALVVNFLLLRQWTFKGSDIKLRNHLARYGLLAAFNLPVTTLFVHYLTTIPIPAFFAKLVVIGFAAVWNFIVYDRIIFRH